MSKHSQQELHEQHVPTGHQPEFSPPFTGIPIDTNSAWKLIRRHCVSR